MSDTHKKTSKETVERVEALLAPIGDVRTRNMMGGYLVYLDEVLIGQINEDRLHIKITSSGEQYADHMTQASPYPGAKPAFRIELDEVNGADWFYDFIRVTQKDLR